MTMKMLVENFYSANMYPAHVVAVTSTATGSEETSNFEPFRIATGRRHSRDRFTPQSENIDISLVTSMDKQRAADMWVLDRGHNLAGETVALQASDQSDFSTYTEVFSITVPSEVTLDAELVDGEPIRTYEGAVMVSFNLHAARYWRTVISAMGAGQKPEIIGMWLGRAWQPEKGPRLPWDDEGGTFSDGARRIPRGASWSIRIVDDAEWAEVRGYLTDKYWKGYPAWFVPDVRNAERSWMGRQPDGSFGAPMTDHNGRRVPAAGPGAPGGADLMPVRNAKADLLLAGGECMERHGRWVRDGGSTLARVGGIDPFGVTGSGIISIPTPQIRGEWIDEMVSVGAATPETRTVRGLTMLVETFSSSLINSGNNEFDTADWTKTNGTITTSQADPKGGTHADKLVENAGSGEKYVDQDAAITASSNGVFSVFAKADGRDVIRMLILGRSGAVVTDARFDLITGDILGVTPGGTYGIQAVGNGWYRCWVSGDVATGGSTPNCRIYLVSGTSTTNYTGDGSSGVLLWGAMVEEDLEGPSSYADGTTGRNAENLYFDFPHAPQPMTMYADFIERGTFQATGAARGILTIGNATTYAQLFKNASGEYGSRTSVTGQAATPAGSPVYGDRVELMATLNSQAQMAATMAINGVITRENQLTTGILPSAWGAERAYVNDLGGTTPGYAAFRSVKVSSGLRSLAYMRAA